MTPEEINDKCAEMYLDAQNIYGESLNQSNVNHYVFTKLAEIQLSIQQILRDRESNK